MKVLVCGGRDYDSSGRVREVLTGLGLGPGDTVIEGGARGADRLAREVARDLGCTIDTFPADWRRYGRAAGPRRNARMLEEQPNLVVAFPGGAGTANMVKQASSAGVAVLEIDRAVSTGG